MKHSFKITAYPYVEGTDEFHFEISTDVENKEDAIELVEALFEEDWQIEIDGSIEE